MYKSIRVATLATVFILAGIPAHAEVAEGTQQTAAAVHQGRGTVNKVNLQAGKINLSHEPIKSLKWPKMTMDFNVEDKSSLAELKPGMMVDFELAKFGSGYRITRIISATQ